MSDPPGGSKMANCQTGSDITVFGVVQMDAVNRSCVVSAHFGSHQVHLVVKFPAQYPNNAAPSFQFVSPTTIPSAMKTKIQKVPMLLKAPQLTVFSLI